MAKRATAKASPAPTFASERAEREYWETHDAGGVVDWASARRVVFPNLKASTETISLRLPTALLADLKVLANKRDVPYQSLLKVYLAERVTSETTGNTRSNKALQPTSRGRRRTARG
ncbi:MAG: BrnA antitoxin family protein [Vicinamibacterales bacterium]